VWVVIKLSSSLAPAIRFTISDWLAYWLMPCCSWSDTDHFIPSSSVLCCHLHLPPAVLETWCPHVSFSRSYFRCFWSWSFSVALYFSIALYTQRVIKVGHRNFFVNFHRLSEFLTHAVDTCHHRCSGYGVYWKLLEMEAQKYTTILFGFYYCCSLHIMLQLLLVWCFWLSNCMCYVMCAESEEWQKSNKMNMHEYIYLTTFAHVTIMCILRYIDYVIVKSISQYKFCMGLCLGTAMYNFSWHGGVNISVTHVLTFCYTRYVDDIIIWLLVFHVLFLTYTLQWIMCVTVWIETQQIRFGWKPTKSRKLAFWTKERNLQFCTIFGWNFYRNWWFLMDEKWNFERDISCVPKLAGTQCRH